MLTKKRIETLTLYLAIIFSIFLINALLFSNLSRDILKTLVRMGMISSNTPQTFSLSINTENLKPGSVVAYKSYAKDVDGRWNETELKFFSIEAAGVISETTMPRQTTMPITICALEGDPCRSDENCCYGYCCDGYCSSTECKEKLGFWWYLLAIPVLVVIVVIVLWARIPKKTEEDEFERLKEKWSGGGTQ